MSKSVDFPVPDSPYKNILSSFLKSTFKFLIIGFEYEKFKFIYDSKKKIEETIREKDNRIYNLKNYIE